MSDCHARPSMRYQRDPHPQTRALQSRSSSRDMSWRKPVPTFVPSPPISPNLPQSPQYTESPTTTTFGFTMDRANPFSMSLTSLNHDMPPLPTDWREAIDRVTRSESLRTPPITPVVTSPTHGFMHGYYHAAAVSQSRITEVDKDQPMFQEVDLGEMKSRDRHRLVDKENAPPPSFNQGLKRLTISPYVNESSTSLYRTPKTYRPPTPPLPSRKRTSAPPTPVTATMNKPMHIVYPDLMGLGAETHSQRTKSPDSDDNLDAHTLRSSLTMWTNYRGAETSTLADDDDRTLPVYQPHSVRKSIIGSKTMVVVEPQNPESGFWSLFRLWLDSFSKPLKSCWSDA